MDSADDDINDYKDALCEVFKNNQNETLVIDNSSSIDLVSILKWRRKYNAGNRVIVLLNHEHEPLPELADYNFVVLDAKNDLEKELNLSLEEKGVLSEELKLKVKNFCQNDNQYVSLITTTMTGGETAIDFDGSSLTNRLSGYKKGTIKRTILQSLALFEYIGYKSERRGEIEFILTNKNITCLK